MVEQLSVFLENKAGRLAEMTRALGSGGFNMRALMVADTADYGVARILVDRPEAAKHALEAAGFGVSLTEVIAVEVPDRPGGLADVLDALGAASLNIEYAYCFVESCANTAVDIFRVDDPGRAGEALRAAGFGVLEAEQLYEADASV